MVLVEVLVKRKETSRKGFNCYKILVEKTPVELIFCASSLKYPIRRRERDETSISLPH